MREARLEDPDGAGLAPATDGWFVVNVADARGARHPQGGAWIRFESTEYRFADFGINVHLLEPGQPNALYHRESAQEDFLVLHGECLLIVEGEERRLRAWDFVHCPAGTAHVFVGAGEGTCAILMVGARREDEAVHYPVEPLAARHGASVDEPSDDPRAAYPAAGWAPQTTPERLPWPPDGGATG